VVDRPQAIGGAVGPGEDAEHARHLLRLLDRNSLDARVRVGRAHHRRVRLALELQIVGEAPGSRQEARIFLARERLADHSARTLESLLPILRHSLSAEAEPEREAFVELVLVAHEGFGLRRRADRGYAA
jgi:hypothetical protein